MKVAEKSTQKRWCIFGIAVFACVVVLLGLLIWWPRILWAITGELHAKCDDGFTIWRRNPGAFSSYIFEIREGGAIVETGLRSRNPDLNDFMKEHRCTILGGG